MNSNMNQKYLMENPDEIIRLEAKTDPEVIKREARWCGLKPGLKVLDAGCGPGKTTSILAEMIQPGGSILGVDASRERVQYAKQHYASSDIKFEVHDLTKPMKGFGGFDLIWCRFVMEYFRGEGTEIVKNLTQALNPGGYICLIDLDNNCQNFYGLPVSMEKIIFRLMKIMEQKYNFDPWAGRKLYTYLYDEGFESIEVDLKAHHLIYDEMSDVDIFDWMKKIEIGSEKGFECFDEYPGGYESFNSRFKDFLHDPRRFIYTPLILCKGRKPV